MHKSNTIRSWTGVFVLVIGLGWASTARAQVGVFEGVEFIAENLDCSATPGATAALFKGGTYTLSSLGGDVWNDGDHLTYLYSEVEGDFDLSAHMPDDGVTVDPTTGWAKTGIMARENLTGSSKHGFVHKPTYGSEFAAHGPNTQFTNRPTSDAGPGGTGGPDVGVRHEWQRLARRGDEIFAYGSADGIDWGDPLPGTLNWGPGPLLVGLAQSSNTANCDLVPSTGTFDNVTFSTGAQVAPPNRTVTERSCGAVVNVSQLLEGEDAAELVQVVEEVSGAGITAASIAAPGADVQSIVDVETTAPVGIFQNSLPVGTGDNVGCIGEPGEWVASEAGGVYTVSDSWGDVWAGGDNFTLVYNEVKGDFRLTAHIVSRDPGTSNWGRSAIMARQDLSRLSRHRMVHDPLFASGAQCTNWGGRVTHGAGSDFWINQGAIYDWYRLERVGDEVAGYGSHDGVDFVRLLLDGGTACTEEGPQQGLNSGAVPRPANGDVWDDAPETMLVGLAVSGMVQAKEFFPDPPCGQDPATVVYDNVELIADEIVSIGEPRGAVISWTDVSRGELADPGLSYGVDAPAGAANFVGDVNGLGTEGVSAVALTLPCADFVRGEVNNDGEYNITDGIFLLNFLFTNGSRPPCADAGDVDDSGLPANVTDAIYLFAHQFQAGDPPPAPYPACGPGGGTCASFDCP